MDNYKIINTHTNEIIKALNALGYVWTPKKFDEQDCLLDVNDATHEHKDMPESHLYLHTSMGIYAWMLDSSSWEESDCNAQWHKDNTRPIQEQGLISGADALRALADGKEVEYSVNNSDWELFAESKVFCPRAILSGINQNSQALSFRLKPRTITLSLEIPAPFEPKDGDTCFIVDSEQEDGFYRFIFSSDSGSHQNLIQFGVYPTKEEIKQVVAALRGIKG